MISGEIRGVIVPQKVNSSMFPGTDVDFSKAETITFVSITA